MSSPSIYRLKLIIKNIIVSARELGLGVSIKINSIRSVKDGIIVYGEYTSIREKGYSVQCIELPGCISQGETREEALKNTAEAIEGYLEAFLEEPEN